VAVYLGLQTAVELLLHPEGENILNTRVWSEDADPVKVADEFGFLPLDSLRRCSG